MNRNFCLSGVKILEEEDKLISGVYRMSGSDSCHRKTKLEIEQGGGIDSFLTEPVGITRVRGLTWSPGPV